MSSSFGRCFRVTTFGESHGPAVGAVVDGCPAGLALTTSTIQRALDRRRPGQSHLVTQRKEADHVEILSGVEDDYTLGSPIALLVRNNDARPKDYRDVTKAYRPSHAEYTYDAKYGRHAATGGGRASARETVGRVAAGAIAEALLMPLGVEIVGWVSQIGECIAPPVEGLTRASVDATLTRCGHAESDEAMTTLIEQVRKAGDSVGGVVSVEVRGVPAGLGAPVFDKLEADLAKALMSLPASKGFEIGEGFAAARMRGSAHNDLLYRTVTGRLGTHTNHAGGIVGGISNGEPLRLRVAFKPTATIAQAQATVDIHGQPTVITGRGRHDPCVLPRAVPIVEAMVALVLADHMLQQRCARV